MIDSPDRPKPVDELAVRGRDVLDFIVRHQNEAKKSESLILEGLQIRDPKTGENKIRMRFIEQPSPEDDIDIIDSKDATADELLSAKDQAVKQSQEEGLPTETADELKLAQEKIIDFIAKI